MCVGWWEGISFHFIGMEGLCCAVLCYLYSVLGFRAWSPPLVLLSFLAFFRARPPPHPRADLFLVGW